MPELPEVQVLADCLDGRLRGSLLASVELCSLSALKTVIPALGDLTGRRVAGFQRHGKFLAMHLSAMPARGGDEDGDDDGHGDRQDDATYLVWHLGRAGWVHWRDELPAAPLRPGKNSAALRLGFVTVDGESIGGFDLTEAGTTKHLAIYVVTDPMQVPGIARLGIEPLSEMFTAEAFDAICGQAGRTQLKGLLRDQSRIAGIGNAYSDEILHAARLSPFQPTDALDDEHRRTLHQCIRTTLEEAIVACRGADPQSLKDLKRAHLQIHGRTGQPCPTCQTAICEIAFADRSMQYCPTCQTGGRVLADRRLSRLLK